MYVEHTHTQQEQNIVVCNMQIWYGMHKWHKRSLEGEGGWISSGSSFSELYICIMFMLFDFVANNAMQHCTNLGLIRIDWLGFCLPLSFEFIADTCPMSFHDLARLKVTTSHWRTPHMRSLEYLSEQMHFNSSGFFLPPICLFCFHSRNYC